MTAAAAKARRVEHAIHGSCLDCWEDAEPDRSRCWRHLRLHRKWSRRCYRKRIREARR